MCEQMLVQCDLHAAGQTSFAERIFYNIIFNLWLGWDLKSFQMISTPVMASPADKAKANDKVH